MSEDDQRQLQDFYAAEAGQQVRVRNRALPSEATRRIVATHYRELDPGQLLCQLVLRSGYVVEGTAFASGIPEEMLKPLARSVALAKLREMVRFLAFELEHETEGGA